MLPWLAWLLAFMSGLAPLLAALGWTRTRKRRPSLKALELEHWLAGGPPAAQVFKTRRPSAAAAGLAPETAPETGPAPGTADPRAIARFLGAALYQLSGLPLLLRMVDPRPPPKRADAAGDGPPGAPPAVQHIDLDGLQFYRIVADVGAEAVATAVRAGIGRAAQQVAAAPSIGIIRDQYPDFICLERRAAAAPSAPRMDLISALLRSDQGCIPPSAKGIAPHRAAAARQQLASPQQRKLETSYLQVA